MSAAPCAGTAATPRHPVRSGWLLAPALAPSVGLAAPAAAQTLQGRVVESASGTAVAER